MADEIDPQRDQRDCSWHADFDARMEVLEAMNPDETQTPSDQSDSEAELLEAVRRLREVAQSEFDQLGDALVRGSTTTTFRRWTWIGQAIAFADGITEGYRK